MRQTKCSSTSMHSVQLWITNQKNLQYKSESINEKQTFWLAQTSLEIGTALYKHNGNFFPIQFQRIFGAIVKICKLKSQFDISKPSKYETESNFSLSTSDRYIFYSNTSDLIEFRKSRMANPNFIFVLRYIAYTLLAFVTHASTQLSRHKHMRDTDSFQYSVPMEIDRGRSSGVLKSMHSCLYIISLIQIITVDL